MARLEHRKNSLDMEEEMERKASGQFGKEDSKDSQVADENTTALIK